MLTVWYNNLEIINKWGCWNDLYDRPFFGKVMSELKLVEGVGSSWENIEIYQKQQKDYMQRPYWQRRHTHPGNS